MRANLLKAKAYRPTGRPRGRPKGSRNKKAIAADSGAVVTSEVIGTDLRPPLRFSEARRWLIVGEDPTNSLLVCGGTEPIAINVGHHDSAALERLLRDLNHGNRQH